MWLTLPLKFFYIDIFDNYVSFIRIAQENLMGVQAIQKLSYTIKLINIYVCKCASHVAYNIALATIFARSS